MLAFLVASSFHYHHTTLSCRTIARTQFRGSVSSYISSFMFMWLNTTHKCNLPKYKRAYWLFIESTKSNPEVGGYAAECVGCSSRQTDRGMKDRQTDGQTDRQTETCGLCMNWSTTEELRLPSWRGYLFVAVTALNMWQCGFAWLYVLTIATEL